MFIKSWKKYSYVYQKTYFARLRMLILRILLVILAYFLLTNIFFHALIMESSSMQPSINPGDRMFFSLFTIHDLMTEMSLLDSLPYQRGDIVSVDMSGVKEGFFEAAADRFFRLWTAGRIGLPGKKNKSYIKRVIGLPGDEVSMVNFVMQVRPKGNPYTLTEYELSGKIFYRNDIPQVPAIWDASLPFSGSMPKIKLGEGECFLLSDDRSNTNDSRTWGPVPVENITAKVLFRYWPPNRAGFP